DVLRMIEIADIEDADPAEPFLTRRIVDALAAAVEPAVVGLARDDQEVLVDGHVALRRGTVVRRSERRMTGIRNVPDLEAVEVALNDEVAGERHIGVHVRRELLGRTGARLELEIPCG